MNELIESTVPENQSIQHAETTQIVRNLCENKIRHTPHRRRRTVKILTPAPSTGKDQSNFHGAKMIKFMGGRKCTVYLLREDIYEIVWDDGKRGGATTRELQTEFSRL